jgi:hypothetical protein
LPYCAEAIIYGLTSNAKKKRQRFIMRVGGCNYKKPKISGLREINRVIERFKNTIIIP